jgi:hypothetical protein
VLNSGDDEGRVSYPYNEYDEIEMYGPPESKLPEDEVDDEDIDYYLWQEERERRASLSLNLWSVLGRRNLRRQPPRGSRLRGPTRAPRRVVRVARRRAAARSPGSDDPHEPDLATRRCLLAEVAA